MAAVVCPGMGRLQTEEGCRSFAVSSSSVDTTTAMSRASSCFARTRPTLPRSCSDLTSAIDRVMHDAGVHPRL